MRPSLLAIAGATIATAAALEVDAYYAELWLCLGALCGGVMGYYWERRNSA
jgi:hypothetical protein